MKLLTYKKNEQGEEILGLLDSSGQRAAPLSDFGVAYSDMNDLIESITEKDYMALTEALQNAKAFTEDIHDLIYCAPIPRPKQDIICLGVNYLEHAKEAARFKKESFDIPNAYPVYFSKRVHEAAGHLKPIPAYEDIVDSLDYEVELAVILGKDAKDVKAEDAEDYVFGYTILNDMSARNLQTRHTQWYFGKSLDGFAPMGPVIVTKDEIQYPPKLNITCKVNEELRQSANTELLIFDIGYVMEELSRNMTLKAGTIISTGTPKGVGMGFEPPRFLSSGDVIECRIEKIGTLINQIGV